MILHKYRINVNRHEEPSHRSTHLPDIYLTVQTAIFNDITYHDAGASLSAQL